MCINTTLDAPLTVAGETLEYLDSFTYLGSVIIKDGSAQKDNENRLTKARNAFASLRPVWRLLVYSIRTLLNLYNSIVKSVLLYRSESEKASSPVARACFKDVCQQNNKGNSSREKKARRTKSNLAKNSRERDQGNGSHMDRG